jgi:hypothetical protein
LDQQLVLVQGEAALDLEEKEQQDSLEVAVVIVALAEEEVVQAEQQVAQAALEVCSDLVEVEDLEDEQG